MYKSTQGLYIIAKNNGFFGDKYNNFNFGCIYHSCPWLIRKVQIKVQSVKGASPNYLGKINVILTFHYNPPLITSLISKVVGVWPPSFLDN